MARHPRLIFPDVALHIRQRGNDRQACFRHEADRLVYLSNLGELCRRWSCALHAYCLMTNHVHLLLTPRDPDAPALLMRDLGRCYVPYFNRRHHRTGSLWEGRFRSCLVESPVYVLACYRYIELNPVRADMVASPAEYLWSSFSANHTGAPDGLLTPHVEYLALANDASRRCENYAGLFENGDDAKLTAALREATDGGYPLVSEDFKQRLAAAGARVERGKPGPRAASDRVETSGEQRSLVGAE